MDMASAFGVEVALSLGPDGEVRGVCACWVWEGGEGGENATSSFGPAPPLAGHFFSSTLFSTLTHTLPHPHSHSRTPVQVTQTYVPYLSAIQLFARDR
jgi:hypothetical protein